MSSRETSPTMPPSKTRHSVKAQKPRHIPRTGPQATSQFTSHVSPMAQPNFALASGAPEYCPELLTCWPSVTEPFYPGNDSTYIPTSSVAPTDLTNTSYLGAMANYDVDSSSTVMSSGSSGSTKTCISPPMSEAEILYPELYRTSPAHLGIDQFSSYTDHWVHPSALPPTPPADTIFDDLDLFNTGKNDQINFATLPEPAMPECEYLGVSKLQFFRSSHS